ncbi:YcaO-like family protein [Streptomyces sp. NPDC013953]|uniref:YcaO-like family protein n=1 Tax=Streptomyces sp. NPDC013953 TaxID=3364868 RepID=UPI0036FCCA4D
MSRPSPPSSVCGRRTHRGRVRSSCAIPTATGSGSAHRRNDTRRQRAAGQIHPTRAGERQWAERGGRHNGPDREPRPRRPATSTKLHGVRPTVSPPAATPRTPRTPRWGGLLELVERDAAVIFWSNRLTLPTLNLSLLPDGPAREMASRLTAGGARLLCKDLTTDLGVPVAGVQVVGGTGARPVVTHAVRAALDMHDAVQGALEEACLCLASTETVLDRDGVPEPDQDLRTVLDFARYSCATERLSHLKFFEDGPLLPPPHPRTAPCTPQADLTDVVDRLAAAGYETITVDITPVDIHECGVAVVRTIVPGLCPITLRRDFNPRSDRHRPRARRLPDRSHRRLLERPFLTPYRDRLIHVGSLALGLPRTGEAPTPVLRLQDLHH